MCETLAPIMKKNFYLLTFVILTSCTAPKTDSCKGQILDLEMNSFDDTNNKILEYYRSKPFIEITDTNQLLKFYEPRRIAQFIQPSAIDSTKRKYTFKVKEAIFKTKNYQCDLHILIDNDNKNENIKTWLKSYDKSRKQIGHLDFAGWSADKEWFISGRIDCDSTIHVILNEEKEEYIYKTNEIGNINLIETIQL
jgi:hypothetical protein